MDYEYQRFALPRDMSRGAARRYLSEQAERGGWELMRVRITADGLRRVELRRRVIKVRSTLGVFVRP